MPKVVGLGHVGIYCRDLEKMAGFYRQPDDAILARVERHWQRVKHVPVGGLLESDMAEPLVGART